METHFLPAEKESLEKVFKQNLTIKNDIGKTLLLDAVPILYLILNDKRQIVWANKATLDFTGYKELDQILSLRPGELFNCSHAYETEGGCGTTEFCTTCGAAIAINAGLNGKIEYQECRIEQKDSKDSLDLKVTSTPYNSDGEKFVIFTIEDISHKKRRVALERIFFHDIANIVGNIDGYLKILDPSNIQGFNDDKQILISLSQDLLDEIDSQKLLVNAENNDLPLNISTVNSLVLLTDKIKKFQRHYITTDKNLVLSPDTADYNLQTDATLLKRVIGNMIKNAIEASNHGGTITVGSFIKDNSIEFWVHNETHMPREIQLQLFHRSFSTKGTGRGLGTYSMKLLGEKYMGGKVSYTSTQSEGTTFRMIISL